MDDQAALDAHLVAIDQQILAASADIDDPTPGQQFAQFWRNLVAQLRRPNDYAIDRRSDQFRRQPTAADFHFRQFRHRLSLRQNQNNIANLLDFMRS